MTISGTGYVQAQDKTSDSASELPKVYLIKEITPENLVKIYEALGRKAEGKVAVKLSTGEPGGHNFLQPTLIAPLVRKMNGTIVECNTAYGGGRANTEAHLKAAADHGFTAIAKVDIMDADGEVSLPVKGGKHLKEDFVGKNYLNYDPYSTVRMPWVVLSHFKAHRVRFLQHVGNRTDEPHPQRAFFERHQRLVQPHGRASCRHGIRAVRRLVGFGGAIKNISIGIASSGGKAWIHSAGTTKDVSKVWGNLPEQDNFLESMAEAAKAVTDHCGDKILYISVANNLSVDCDCDSSPEDPRMGDIGILASLDPVALDRACTDLVRSSEDHGKIHLIERIDSRHGMHTLDYAEQLGMGSQKYELVELK